MQETWLSMFNPLGLWSTFLGIKACMNRLNAATHEHYTFLTLFLLSKEGQWQKPEPPEEEPLGAAPVLQSRLPAWKTFALPWLKTAR
jgi:hypothetical protein